MNSNPAYKEELRRFAELFENEERLRDEVATVLSKIPGVTGVRITHGSQEFGKDIVFFAQSGLNPQALYACVIKNAPINGSADSNHGARTVVHQAEQSLDTPHTHTDGQQLIPAKIYIVTPFDTPQATLNSVSSKLRSFAGRIEFLAGPQLLDLFKRYSPELFFLGGDIFGAYMVALRRAVETSSEISNIAFQASFISAATRSLSDRYVRPHFHLVIRKFDFTYQIPSSIYLNREFSERELEKLQHPAELLTAILETSGFQQALVEIADTRDIIRTAETLRKTLPEMIRSWRSGSLELQELEARKQRRGKSPTADTPSRSVADQWKRLIDKTLVWIEKFRLIVSKLDTKSSIAKEDPLRWLSAVAQTKYYCVADTAQLLASAAFPTIQEDVITLPRELPENTKQSLLITGAAGYGKTSFCRYNVMRDIDNLLAKTSNRIPVYIPLHRLALNQINRLEEILEGSSENKDCVLDIRKITGRPIRMYLDGLDEIPSLDRQQQIMEVVRQTAREMPNLQVVVTARDYISGAWLHWLARVQIAEFTNAEIHEFVSKSTGGDELVSKDFFLQIESVPNLVPLLSIPLLATLILCVYSKTRQLPDSKAKLYDLFISLLCGGWDDAKGVQRHGQYGPEPKKQILTALAASLHESKKRNCNSLDFQKAVGKIAPRLKDQSSAILNELLKDGSLVPAGQSYAFAHLSFQEYLAAKQLLSATPDRATRRLQWYLQGDDWWKEVLSFYVGLVQNPDDTEQWLLRTERDVSKMASKSPDIAKRIDFLKKSILATFTAYQLRNGII